MNGLATAKKREVIRFFPDADRKRQIDNKPAVKLIRTEISEEPQFTIANQNSVGTWGCTFETHSEYADPYSSINRIAKRNGRFENEKDALAAAKEAGYTLNDIAVVFFLG